MPLDQKPAIGIDLGTTYSCVAVFQHGKVEIIHHHETGNRTTPSQVAFTECQRFVGDAARNQDFQNPKNTVFDAKRLIGRRFDDPKIQKSLSRWPFAVLNENNTPKIQVNYKGETRVFNPEEISAMVLENMKEVAERYLGETVRNAVVTVPAYFDDSQRQATIDACTIAGLNVLKLAIEPTAAAVAYGLDKNIKGERSVLVYDLGGGTFDVSILTIKPGPEIKVKAITGDTFLGGQDFDNRLVDHLASDFQKKFKINLKENLRALCRLKKECERAKRTLSSVSETKIQIDCISENIDLCARITRAKFEDLCLDLFKDTLKHVEQALSDAKLSKSQIDDVVLVGGSTRIPKIQKLLQNFFDGKEPSRSIHPDEAVAYGAAVQAALLNGDQSEVIKDIMVVDVTPLSLGVSADEGMMSVIIKRNTTIPAKASKSYKTSADNQTTVCVEVYEGERAKVEDNHFLGKFDISGIPPAPRGVAKLTETFILDENGILKVVARIDSTGKEESMKITMDKGRLTADEIKEKVAEAERFREEDRKYRECSAARIMLEDYAYDVKHALEDAADGKLTKRERSLATEKCSEVLNWLKDNPQAEKRLLEERLKKLNSICSPLMSKIY